MIDFPSLPETISNTAREIRNFRNSVVISSEEDLAKLCFEFTVGIVEVDLGDPKEREKVFRQLVSRLCDMAEVNT